MNNRIWRILSRIFELLANKDLRQWLFFKILNPSDKFENPFFEPTNLKNHQFKISEGINYIKTLPLEFKNAEDIHIRLASQQVSPEDFLLLQQNLQIKSQTALSGEDREALYRFNGLLLLAIDQSLSLDFFEKNIDLWINKYNDIDVAMNPYVIAERLSNIGILISRSKIYEQWSKQKQALFKTTVQRDIISLINNLEYFGEKLTGNHLSNNARGVAWGAYLINDISLLTKSIQFAQSEASRILDTDTILREGSSNYQSLITRNYLELAMLAELTRDDDIKSSLNKLNSNLCIRSRYLRPNNLEAFIGDISPDFPHQYFVDVPYYLNNSGAEKKSCGWSSHFVEKIFITKEQWQEKTQSYCRFDQNNFSMLAHLNDLGYPILAGHSHCDSGSFVVNYNNQEILIDLGRNNYDLRLDPEISSPSHNFIQIDGQPLENQIRGVYGPKYLQTISSEAAFGLLTNGLYFDFTWKQFSHKIKHRREVRIIDKQICIEDHLQTESQHEHEIQLQLYFASEDMARRCTSSLGPLIYKQILRNQDYGKSSTAWKTFTKNRLILPTTISTVIDCQNL